MPKRYAREFRRAVCTRLVAGEKVSSLSTELGVSEGTLYLWKRQALIDAGRAEGVKSFEADELARRTRPSLSSRPNSRPSRPRVPCSTGRSRSAQKAVPDCPRPEQSGLHRALRVSDRRGLAPLLLRAQVPRAE